MTNRNIIRLAIPIQIGTIFLPRILGDFKNKFPSINFDIIETGGIDSLNLLENDKIDLAITNYKAELENIYHQFPNLRQAGNSLNKLLLLTYIISL